MGVEVQGFQRLNFVFSYKEVTSDYSLKPGDDVIGADATSGQITVTLPPAASVRGKQYVVKRLNDGVNSVIVDAFGSEQVDQSTGVTLASQDASTTVFSTGTKWLIV